MEAVLIHKTPAGLSPRLIPSSPQSLNFFSNSMPGLFCLLDFSLIWGDPVIRDTVLDLLCLANRPSSSRNAVSLSSARLDAE
jgi:hypothetical protein